MVGVVARTVDGDPATAWSNAYAQPATPLLPQITAAATVEILDGGTWRPVPDPVITWATASGEPTTITFPGVRGNAIRLDLTSAHPEQPDGSLRIAELSLQ